MSLRSGSGKWWLHRWTAGLVVLLSFVLITIPGCGGSGSSSASGTAGVQLTQIDVEPSTSSIAKGTSQIFIATGIYSDGSSQDITAQASWISSDSNVATINNTAGSNVSAESLAAGTATITAALAGISADTSLTVTNASLVRLEITPGSPSIANGTSAALTATGLYSDGTSQDLTAQVTWQSSDSSIATVGTAAPNSGLVAAVGVGGATISATLGSTSDSVSLTVTGETLTSIVVDPVLPSLAKGTQLQMSAIGEFSDGSTQDLTRAATWTSSADTVAAVGSTDGSRGLVTSASTGTTTITASLSGVDGSTILTVTNAVLSSINITAHSSTVPSGAKMQASAVGTFTDGSTRDITDQVTWVSSQTSKATVSNASGSKGLITALAPGAINITATLSGITASHPIAVTNATLASINVNPPSLSIAAGVSSSLTATGNYSDGSTLDVTDQVSWLTSDASVMQVSNAAGNQGYVTAISPGSADINATLGGITGTSRITVTNATLSTIEVTPASPSVAEGLKMSMHATGHFSDSSTLDITGQVTWQSSDTGIAVISNVTNSKGSVTGISAGAANLTATLGAVNSTPVVLAVTNAQLSSIQVTPANPAVVKGSTVQLTAIGSFTNGAQQDITSQVVWRSSDTAVATVSNASGSNGLVTGAGQGQIDITATLGSVQASVTLGVTVDHNSPISLTAVASPNIILNNSSDASTISVTVEPVDSAGAVVDGTQIDFQITGGAGTLSVAQALTVNGVATVDLTSASTGVVTVTATVDGTSISNYSPVYVTPHLYDALGKSIIFSATKDNGGNIQAGSAFGFYITNFSNRPFDLVLYQFSNGGSPPLYSTSDPAKLNGGHLLPGESTGTIFTLSTNQPNSLQAGYLLTDQATTTSFGVSVAYLIP